MNKGFVAIAAIIALGAVLRFWGLGAQSFWYDEVATTLVIRASLWHVFPVLVRQEATPPLYYLLAWLWTQLTAVSEIGLRSLSAVIGVGTIWFTWAAAREGISERAGVFAAAIVAVNPMLIWFSQEARAYQLLAMLSAATLWLTVRACRRPSRRVLAAWSAVCCLTLLTQYFGVFIVVPELGLLVWLLPQRRREIAVAFIPVVLVGLALIPLAHAQEHDGRTAWIGTQAIGTRLDNVLQELLTANTSRISSNSDPPGWRYGAVGAAGIVLAVALSLLSRRSRHDRGVHLAVIVGAAALVLPLLLAPTSLDFFLDRNLIGAWIPLAVAIGGALALSQWPRAATLALGIIVAAGLAVTVAVQRDPSLQRTDWRAAARTLGAATVTRAIIVKPSYASVVLNFYGQPLSPMPAGTRVQEVDVIGEGVDISAPTPRGFTATTRKSVPGVGVLRFRAKKPLVVTRTVIRALGGTVFIELSPATTRWVDGCAAALISWDRALSDLGHTADARPVLAAADRTVDALAARPPTDLPDTDSLLHTLRHIASLAVAVAAHPTSGTELPLRRALRRAFQADGH